MAKFLMFIYTACFFKAISEKTFVIDNFICRVHMWLKFSGKMKPVIERCAF